MENTYDVNYGSWLENMDEYFFTLLIAVPIIWSFLSIFMK